MSRTAPGDGAPSAGDVDLDRDRALVRRCQEGDGAAFAELYTQYHDRLHRFCMRRLLDRDEADEVTQEAFLRAWRALPTFAGGLRFYPWLTVIAKNLCTDLLRRRSRYGTVADFDRQPADAARLDGLSSTMSSEEAVMASFDGELAAEALTRLSERHRNVLALREEAGLSYQEIATAEGVEISTIETLLWRARQALKREYVALSGSRAFAGLLVFGAAVRGLGNRLARRMSRLALAADRVRVRDLAAAGVVTVALATVAASPGPSAKAEPAAVGPAAATAGSPTLTPGLPQLPGAGAAPAAATTPPSGPPGATTPTATSSPPPPAGIPSVPATGSGIVGGATAALPNAASQVPVVTQKLAGTVESVLGGAASNLPIPPQPSVPSPVPKVVTGVKSALGGL